MNKDANFKGPRSFAQVMTGHTRKVSPNSALTAGCIVHAGIRRLEQRAQHLVRAVEHRRMDAPRLNLDTKLVLRLWLQDQGCS